MWSSILQNVALSVLSILLIQSLWDYFKDKLTTKKTKDLVDFQTKKYREMLKDVQESVKKGGDMEQVNGADEYISPEEKQRMIEELMSFVAW